MDAQVLRDVLKNASPETIRQAQQDAKKIVADARRDAALENIRRENQDAAIPSLQKKLASLRRARKLHMTAMLAILLAIVVLLLTSCTTATMPNGGKLSTAAEIKNLTMTATAFHADEISHAGVWRSAQNLVTMLGLGAFLP